jgi:hypothetical protein
MCWLGEEGVVKELLKGDALHGVAAQELVQQLQHTMQGAQQSGLLVVR